MVALGLALVGYLLVHLTWGVQAGARHLRGYGAVAGAEGVVRLAAAGALVAVGSTSTGGFALCVGVAPVAAAAVGWRVQPTVFTDGPRQPRGEVVASVGLLLGASVAKQFLLMVGPLAVQVLPHPAAEAAAPGRFLAAAALTRAPLFLSNAALAALSPRLAAAATTGQRDTFVRSLSRLGAGVAALAGAATVAAAVLGPTVLRLAFGTAYVLPAGGLVLLSAASGCYLGALVASYGLIALGAHRWVTLSWVLGSLAFVAAVATGESLGLLGRVEWALLVGTALTVTTMVGSLAGRVRRRGWSTPEGVLGMADIDPSAH